MSTSSSPERSVTSWSLVDEIRSVLEEALQQRTRVARTVLKSAEVRVVVVGMAQGVTWPEHKAAGRVLMRVEQGCIELRTGDHASQCSAGILVALEPGELHDVRAIEDAAFVLFVAG